MGTTLHRRPDRPITEFMGMATAAQEMLDFFEQYLPRFQAEKSGHEFKV